MSLPLVAAHEPFFQNGDLAALKIVVYYVVNEVFHRDEYSGVVGR